jgi:hypothetical protein
LKNRSCWVTSIKYSLIFQVLFFAGDGELLAGKCCKGKNVNWMKGVFKTNLQIENIRGNLNAVLKRSASGLGVEKYFLII